MDNAKAITLVTGAALITFIIVRLRLSGKITADMWENLKKSGAIRSPLAGSLKITSPFGLRRHPVTGNQQFHNGVDLVNAKGATQGMKILAPYAGTVVKNWFDPIGGYSLQIDSGYVKFGFAHLAEQSPLKVGTKVRRGQTVGIVGNTGRSTGAHLHFTVRINNQSIDPIQNLPALAMLIV